MRSSGSLGWFLVKKFIFHLIPQPQPLSLMTLNAPTISLLPPGSDAGTIAGIPCEVLGAVVVHPRSDIPLPRLPAPFPQLYFPLSYITLSMNAHLIFRLIIKLDKLNFYT